MSSSQSSSLLSSSSSSSSSSHQHHHHHQKALLLSQSSSSSRLFHNDNEDSAYYYSFQQQQQQRGRRGRRQRGVLVVLVTAVVVLLLLLILLLVTTSLKTTTITATIRRETAAAASLLSSIVEQESIQQQHRRGEGEQQQEDGSPPVDRVKRDQQTKQEQKQKQKGSSSATTSEDAITASSGRSVSTLSVTTSSSSASRSASSTRILSRQPERRQETEQLGGQEQQVDHDDHDHIDHDVDDHHTNVIDHIDHRIIQATFIPPFTPTDTPQGDGSSPTLSPIFETTEERVLLSSNFTANADGFIYTDDIYRDTNQPNYATGSYVSNGGRTGGGLVITLGGIDNIDISGISGGYIETFTLDDIGTNVRITFAYRLIALNFEIVEVTQVLCSVDNVLFGIDSATDYIAQFVGGADVNTGWVDITIGIGNLQAGTHNISIGGFLNSKTNDDEVVTISFDDVIINALTPTPSPTTSSPVVITPSPTRSPSTAFIILLSANYTNTTAGSDDTDGFVFVDDYFRNTNQPNYTSGSYIPNGGRDGNGGLGIQLGNVNELDITDMSGAWISNFTVFTANSTVLLIFDYRIDFTISYDFGEFSDVLVSIDETLIGLESNTDYIQRISTPGTSTAWTTITLELGTLLSAGIHTIGIGGYNNQKTSNGEVTNIFFDNVRLITYDGITDAPTITPGTASPTTIAPTTVTPTTITPTTVTPTTLSPTTLSPTTAIPTTASPTTLVPTTLAPTTAIPTTASPTTLVPTTVAPTFIPTTIAPTTVSPTTATPTTSSPTRSLAPTTVSPTTNAPITPGPNVAAIAPTSSPISSEPLILLETGFNTVDDSDGFIYVDDAFRNTNNPKYASGERMKLIGNDYSRGSLKVELGNKDKTDIEGISGGWLTTFNISSDVITTTSSTLSIKFSYQLFFSPFYERNEYSQVLCSVNDQLYGLNDNDYIAQISGRGALGHWIDITLDNIPLSQTSTTTTDQQYTLIIGVYNNIKTQKAEITKLYIDDVSVLLYR